MLALSMRMKEGIKVGDAVIVLTETRQGVAKISIHADRSVNVARVVVLPKEEQQALLALMPFLVTRLDCQPKLVKATA